MGLSKDRQSAPLDSTRDLEALRGERHRVDALLGCDSSDPHALLGVHRSAGRVVVRAFRPGATTVELLQEQQAALPMHEVADGLFAISLVATESPLRYRLRWSIGSQRQESADPYSFAPTIGDIDQHLHGEGRHYESYHRLGAHPREVDGVKGTSFAVWAPCARRVSVVGPFNDWDGRVHQMRQMGSSGIWEIFIPGVGLGELYKYEIKTEAGQLRLKTDPLAFMMEMRPKSAAVVWGLGDYRWGDQHWIAQRKERDVRRRPMSIYEVHLGSWMRSPDQDNAWLSYRELAPRLVDHCRAHGFTHVELLPIAEHAYDPSWGYQTTGYFAPTARFGDPDGLRELVDKLHQADIGVILDWVPAHFPKDDYALRLFDGTALYEHADPRQGEHRDWGTLIFNYGRNEVRTFLISNALYWIEQFHIDGLRVDAVASLIYLDYSREEGDWVPNRHGGRENLEAIGFLQELNTVVHRRFPGVFTVAEESTAWPGVTAPAYLGGLGFDFKWNMGWMHDTLEYFAKDPVHRSYHHNDLTFGMLYAYSENFVLPLSHDEVVHLKGSLLEKMPGDDWQKAANLRLLLAYQYSSVGKKLLFMGGEFGQRAEWNHDHSLDWHLAAQPLHAGIQQFFKDLGRLYRETPALWLWDYQPRGFHWIDCNDVSQSVLSFARFGPDGHAVCVFNFTPVVRHGYRIGLPAGGRYREALNSDGAAYGGSNVGNGGWVYAHSAPCHGLAHSAEVSLPPLGALVLLHDGSS
ncbi:MAG: 1,4-alpha-glucan branching protein GlgB [Deltaproteobacteria bacterium]|nr:1,4-alpha-glucan branching protein GlgB [Deltaproteobacteria bacterium]